MKKQSKGDIAIEILIALISFISGGFLIYWSVYLIYGYHFTSALWFMMIPMTILVSELVLGILLVISAIVIFVNKPKGAFLYRLSGLFIVLNPININIIDLLQDCWYSSNLYILLFSPIGLLLYLLFNQKIYTQDCKPYNKEIFLIALLIFLLIDLIFYNWSYF